MTRVEFYPYSRVPGSTLAEVEIVLRPTAVEGIKRLVRHYLAGEACRFEAEWPDRMVMVPSMRVVLCFLRANGNVFFRLREVAP